MIAARESNPFEAQAREQKVRSLLNALTAAFSVVVGKVSPETMLAAVEGFQAKEWAALESLAKVKHAASDTTKAALVAQLRSEVETIHRVVKEVEQYERDVDDEGQRLAKLKGWEL